MTEINKAEKIKEAIFKTIVFFDIFSYPLTAFELWQYSNFKCSLLEVENALIEFDNDKIENKGAYYFLKGKSNIVETRARRYNYSDRKMKRAMRISKIFKFIPWIKMIAIGNIMGSNNLKDGSDIDFFIVTNHKRIYLTRFFTTIITKFLLLRPRVNNVRDKICLSFYISENNIDLQKLHLKNKIDLYFIYWLANLMPIYERDNFYRVLIDKNSWIKKTLPNWEPIVVSPHRDIGESPSFFYREVIDLFIGGLEKQFKYLQLKILPNDLRDLMNVDTRVVISDDILKLHVKDRRQEFLELFKEKIKTWKIS
jgi:hypothetical protein